MAGNVFAAITFDENTMAGLAHYRDIILETCPRIPITRPETWHITMAFLGPLASDGQAIETFEQFQFETFPLLIAGFGTFGRGKQQTLWVAVEPSRPLMKTQKALAEAFREAGFELPDRKFTPHLTFSRKWHGDQSALDLIRSQVQPLQTEVSSLRLIRSIPLGSHHEYEVLSEIGYRL